MSLDADDHEARDLPPEPLAPGRTRCSICGNPVSKSNLSRHMETQHGVKSQGKPGRKPRVTASTPPLRSQIEMVYRLGGNVATARGLPNTGNVLQTQAPACAEAWEQIIDQYFPGLRDLLEKGMVAGSVVALIYAHLPIVQTARMEIAAKNAAAESGAYEPPVGHSQAA